MDIKRVKDLEIAGVDRADYPEFCDAFFTFGIWADSGKELTDNELDDLTMFYPEIVNEMAHEHYRGQ